VLVLEARARIGGRCWTARMPGIDAPVELGAEFMHGEANATRALLARAGIAPVDSVRAGRHHDGRRLRPRDSFAEALRAVRGATLAGDMSFERFLAQRKLPQKTKTAARHIVEGFDAADPRRVSARSILEEWGEQGALGERHPRPAGGYGALMDWLARRVLARGGRIQLDSPVRELRWRRGAVIARGSFLGAPFEARAARAVITLPLGVLQSGAVRISPSLIQKREALSRLASGPVIRVAMRFHRPVWQRRYPGVAFFQADGTPFSTFWTPLPLRAPLLTAWAGGPRAARMTGRSPRTLIAKALESVHAIFPDAQLADALVQDWHQDPYARGGYSYVLVNGAGARADLARPIEDTLHFAGEATDTHESGTVAGALRSGLRAAREVLND
jgi:monoamine oxidase